MPRPPKDDEELTYRRMVAALSQRDATALRSLLTEDVELRSNAIAGELVVGRTDVLAAIKAHRDLLFEPTLLSFEHLGDGWMVIPARLRHSLPSGGMADSQKTVLARVIKRKVAVSIVFPTDADAYAELERRR